MTGKTFSITAEPPSLVSAELAPSAPVPKGLDNVLLERRRSIRQAEMFKQLTALPVSEASQIYDLCFSEKVCIEDSILVEFFQQIVVPAYVSPRIFYNQRVRIISKC